ncbi:MAG: hypothetical protein PHW73_07320 [Atribacterota bacterium]|nr:hypothetical protein [Atribacterota bacterium]
MEEQLQKELEINKYFFMKHGYIIIIITIVLIAASFLIIKIDHKSLFQMTIEYYFR